MSVLDDQRRHGTGVMRLSMDALSAAELRILEAIQFLTASIQTVLDSGKKVTRRELSIFSRIGVTPLLDDIEMGLGAGVFEGLKVYHRARLRGHVNNLRRLMPDLEKA